MTTSHELLSLGRDYYLPVYRPRQMVLERGAGSRLWDNQGREYVDWAAGIAVCGLGHNDPDLHAALVEQAAAAADSLREQADRLADTVAVFRTGETGEPSPVAAQPTAPGRAEVPRLPG